jgi:hypothetical protein
MPMPASPSIIPGVSLYFGSPQRPRDSHHEATRLAGERRPGVLQGGNKKAWKAVGRERQMHAKLRGGACDTVFMQAVDSIRCTS